MSRLSVPLAILAAGSALAGPTKVVRADPTLIELTEAPQITEVVPYFTHSLTTITKAGTYTLGGIDCLLRLGIGCLGELIPAPTVCTITGITTKTTTYPCSTATTYTKPEWDLGCGCSLTKTFWWTPHPCTPGATTTVTVSATAPPPLTTTATSTTTETATTTVSATCSAQPTLSCDRFGYLIQYTTLYRVDLETGGTTAVTTKIRGATNSIGYNVLDNFIYGVQDAGGGRVDLVRISASGSDTVVRSLSGGGNAGDVDTDGYYWLSSAGSKWSKIDLRPGSATYGEVLSNGTAGTLGYEPADWVYIPSGGRFLWAVARIASGPNTSSLLRFDMDTHVWSVVRSYTGTPRSGWGAMYGIDTGIVYASDNGGGQIWAFPINGSAATHVTNGPASSANDGARCVLNVLG
ncbi:hypothetical protein VTK56DRAFT_5530 [Thermocarpiscus australiensis]